MSMPETATEQLLMGEGTRTARDDLTFLGQAKISKKGLDRKS